MNKRWPDRESTLKIIEENDLVRRTFKAAFFLNLFYVFMVFMTSMMFPTYLLWKFVALFFVLAVLPALVIYSKDNAQPRAQEMETSAKVKGEQEWFKKMLISFPIMILMVVAFLVFAAPQSPAWTKVIAGWIKGM